MHMNPTTSPPQPPPSATSNHLHSMESSPLYKTTESCCKHNSTYSCHKNGSTKLRLMCSNGGHILPGPHDKSLRYVGGETRMVVVDRHTTLPELTSHLSKTFFPSSCSSLRTTVTSSFTLKYQLPTEDLDSLISLTNDEDLENMIDEYERLNSSSRLRLFIFPTNPVSVSSIESFLENSIKSEHLYLNALNGSNSGFSDTSSVNCLLDLDDEIVISEKKDVCNKNSIGTTNLRGINSGQDVHSIPDSPMMETSSFGSASSTPPHANFQPIKVNADDHLKVVGGGIEGQFSQMGVQKRHQDDPGLIGSPVPLVVSDSPMSFDTPIHKHSDPFLFFHERSEHQQQQKRSSGFNVNSIDSILSDLTITDESSPISQIQSSDNKNQAADPNDTPDQNTRNQMQQQQKIHDSSYVSSMPVTQLGSSRHQLHHQQPQFIPPLQYINHHPLVAVPVTSYYHHHHQPQTDQQNFVYYVPARPPPQVYNFPFQQTQPNHADIPPVTASAVKTELPVYRTTNSGGLQLVRVPSNVGYSQIHQPTQSI